MNKVELLAPAKDLETAIAAINSGADAIYIGASYFGARHNAGNTLESIEMLVNYAHKFYVRVHVTINTILNNDEVPKAIELIKNLYNIGVDAIIIQDMALLKAAIDAKIPPIQIHMSTQCNNRTLDKIKFFDNMGVSRVILARELPLKDINSICNNTNCEIETFVHGALCVSYSGQCYFSYANGGRSANRGECAQPCRKKYSLINQSGKFLIKDKYLLSLKDFNASEHIEKLILYGVKSFKIEGRLKDINYVKNVTLFYNNLINKYAGRTSSGTVFSDFVPDLNKTFNRAYTDYFLKKRSKCYNFLTSKSMGEVLGTVNSVGYNYFETDASVNPQDGLIFVSNSDITGTLVNRVEGNKIYPAKMPKITVGDTIYRNFNSEFNKKLSTCKTVRKIGIIIKIFDNKLIVTDEDNNTVSLKFSGNGTAINLEKARENYVKQLSKTGNSDFYIQNIEIKAENLPFLPLSQINNLRHKIFDLLMEERIRNYPLLHQNPISYAQFPNSDIDYRANIFNEEANDFYTNCGCKVKEYAPEATNKIPSGIELMRTKHCLKYAIGKCGSNSEKLYLQDENGKKYPLEFDCKNCEMVILSI